jgi:outer membrane receptor protein involved in Fe transport
LDAEDESIRAGGHDVVDFNLTKRLKKWVDLNFAVDNLFNKRYFETQNYFESRICPTCDITSQIHATPGYPITFTMGATLRLFEKR